ncbi:cytochrome P450 [Ephemerocybe angulata]|uniref:Cytochrome P450 n=1 Tax=Ephemerocybe angulata TaxID=980116 RepID=A0A8H6I4S3_9AGAR|nr:cytochrome P450 [Tulosesus angulatus]
MAVADALVSFFNEPRNVVVVALCVAITAMIHQRQKSKRGLPLPPGPPGHWLLGNTLPNAFAYRKFEEWTKEYGPIFTIRQGFSTTVVIGRMQAAMDIMEKEGAATVDRPVSIAAGDTLSGGMRVLLTPAGERFKKMRRYVRLTMSATVPFFLPSSVTTSGPSFQYTTFRCRRARTATVYSPRAMPLVHAARAIDLDAALHAHLQPKAVTSYHPVMMKYARQHIIDLIEDPSQHQEHAKRYSASVVMALAYGKDPKSHNDPDIVAVNECLTRLGNNLRPGLWKVDVFPFLKYIPGYLDELKEGHAQELGLFKTQLLQVKQAMERGEEVRDSFGKYLLGRQAELELSDDETAYLAGSMFGAGSDTTASAISVSVMAAACYPETQKRVQEELDRVIGNQRAPTVADQNDLPQAMAFVLETLRWRPVTAGGFAHKTTKDLIWKDYVIPKGTTVMGNVWAVGRDPEYFPDPESFNPQRWLTGDGKLKEDMKSFPFGFGRRVCPGQHMAVSSIFLNTVLTQWAFNIKADPTAPIDPLAFTESANAHPVPFKVILEPRAASSIEGVRELIEDYGL